MEPRFLVGERGNVGRRPAHPDRQIRWANKHVFTRYGPAAYPIEPNRRPATPRSKNCITIHADRL
jgi:hypothetical protein